MVSAILSQALGDDHRRCDRLLAATETAATGKDWDAIAHDSGVFGAAMERHFLFEEQRLFPELEARAPMAAGPTGVMRMEHQQMRQLMRDFAGAVVNRNKDDCLGILETLHMVTQQHNAKEEAILYPMADDVLQGCAEAMAAELAET